jgi:signal transduction histidine kinase
VVVALVVPEMEIQNAFVRLVDPVDQGHAMTPADLLRQMALLSQMVEEISGELSLEPLLSRIVERACRLIGADDGVIGLYVPELDVIRTAASYNIPAEQLSPVLARGHGLTGRVLEMDAPVRVRYGDLPHPVRAAAVAMDMIGMPIRDGDRLIGVFGIGARAGRTLDPGAEALLEQFARHAAVAIGNAHRYAFEQRRAARFALIVRVAGIAASGPEIDTLLQRAADAIHEHLDYPSVDIPLIDPEDPETLVIRIRGGHYKTMIDREDRLPVSRGVMGAAVRERRSQLVTDVASDPRYVLPPGVRRPMGELAVPILHGDEVLGVLNVEGERSFDDLDRQSLEVIAEHLALAIHGGRLFDQSRQLALLEQRRQLARELHDNVTQILSSISMISQSMADAWSHDPAEGAHRAARVSQLSQMAFSELRELLKELTPTPPLRGVTPSRLAQVPISVVQLHQRGLATTAERLVRAMLPEGIGHCVDFGRYRAQSLEHEEALLRICQEAASNAIRHADARTIEIAAGVDDTHAWLRVEDDGRGISARTPPGMGVANMWQRLLALGGQLQIAARRPTGMRIEARLPRQDRPA